MAFKFLADAWHSFKSLFSSAEHEIEKLYKSLPQSDKDALVSGSGFLAVINTELDSAPEVVEATLQKHFINLDIKALEQHAYELAQSFKLTTDGSFHDSIAKLQAYLKGLPTGGIWAGITTGASLAIALLFGGAQEKSEVFMKCLGYVYKYIIRPKIMKTEVPALGTLLAKNVG